MVWLRFLLCSSLIVVSGYVLSVKADMISRKTRFSAGLMGVFFLAIITSFPELFTSLGSVASSVDAPDLAAGDLIGAVAINVFVIALLGMLSGRGSILKGQSRGNLITASLTTGMLLVIMGSVAFTPGWSVAGIGAGSLLLAALINLAAGIRSLIRHLR